MAIKYITIAYETKTAMNNVKKCKTHDWQKRLSWKLLEELRK